MSEDTTLGDLLALQLHKVEDDVKNIVDKAVKEMAIEKVQYASRLITVLIGNGMHTSGW